MNYGRRGFLRQATAAAIGAGFVGTASGKATQRTRSPTDTGERDDIEEQDDSLQQRLDEVGSILTSEDADRIMDLYTQNGQLMPPGRDFVTGREAIADFWIGVVESGVETIDIETVEVENYDGTAMRVGRAVLRDADEATLDRVKFIELWKREDEVWRIHRDIWNSSVADEQQTTTPSLSS